MKTLFVIDTKDINDYGTLNPNDTEVVDAIDNIYKYIKSHKNELDKVILTCTEVNDEQEPVEDDVITKLCKGENIRCDTIYREPTERGAFDYTHHIDNVIAFKSAIDFSVCRTRDVVVCGDIKDYTYKVLTKSVDGMVQVLKNGVINYDKKRFIERSLNNDKIKLV